MSAVAPLTAKRKETLDPVVLCAAFEACGEALAVAADGCVVHANQAFATALRALDGGDAGRDLAGSTCGDGQGEEDAPTNRVAKAADLAGGPRLETTSTNFYARGREWQVVSLRPAEAPAAETRRMEAVGRLVSGVAHDFNNLLTGVLLYCDLLHVGLEQLPQLARHVTEMRGAAERGAALVRQLLEIARQQSARPELLSWNDGVRQVADFLRRLIGENVVLATDLAPGVGLVRMDPAEMQQVILNLVLNARDAIPAGGRITVATRNCRPQSEPQKPAVELEVADTGVGMDEATRARIFHPFFTTKPEGQGSGIGLATVQSIVVKHRGTLSVDTAPGEGTRVLVRLPQALAEGSDRGPDSDPAILRGNSL